MIRSLKEKIVETEMDPTVSQLEQQLRDLNVAIKKSKKVICKS
jgi:hypothetical protein